MPAGDELERERGDGSVDVRGEPRRHRIAVHTLHGANDTLAGAAPPEGDEMGLRTSDQYRKALQDGREVYYRGRRIPDVTDEPDLRVAVDHAALDFEIGHDPGQPRARGGEGSRHRRGVQRVLRATALDRRPAGALAAHRDRHRPRAARWSRWSRRSGPTRSSACCGCLEGEALERAQAFYRALPRPTTSRSAVGADRREGRSLAKARTSRPTPTMYVHVVRRAQRRHRRARREVPHVAQRERATRSSCCPPGR